MTVLPDPPHPLLRLNLPPDEIARRTRAIYDAVLQRSPHLRTGNFTALSAADLRLLFDLYDATFFAGSLAQLLERTRSPLAFHVSSRLTSSAGLTKRFVRKARKDQPPDPPRYEIALSSTLLFQTFRDVERTVHVNGLVCNDRLEAMQRVFEHELVHLVEMMLFIKSSCDRERFKVLARHWFAHTQTRHNLITQSERARVQFDVRVGDRVAFLFEGTRYTGVVNRITQRATILVESDKGQPYTDGKRYAKYYIPLPMLEKVT